MWKKVLENDEDFEHDYTMIFLGDVSKRAWHAYGWQGRRGS